MTVRPGADNGAAEVSVDDRWNFETFYVAIHEVTDSSVGAALVKHGAGRLRDDGHALINVAYLADSAGADEGDSWHAKLAEMLGYASTRGWLSPAGDQVSAHIVRT